MSKENKFPEQHKTPEQFPTQEEVKEALSAEESELYEEYMAKHPEAETSKRGSRECEPEVKELEAMLASFEKEYDLEALHAITDLSPKDAPNHPLRESAKVALIPILERLQVLSKETNIKRERYNALRDQYKRFDRAVGMINQNKVDHTR